MVYAAITSLMSTIQQSMQVTGLSLQVFYEEIESMRAILEKLCDITGWTDSKMKKWMAVKNRLNNIQHLKEQTLTLPSASQHAFESENVMVGHENTFEIMQDRLARGGMELEVVTIVDMGGIDGELEDRLQKLLKGRKYLVVIDDIWTTGAWDDIKLCFPDCDNGSRILLTTRNVEFGEYASTGRSLISIQHLRFDGKIESYGMHDVTCERCLKEARNLNFVSIVREKSDQHPYAQFMQCFFKSRGRTGIHNEEELSRCRNYEAHSIILFGQFQCSVPELPFKLVRVLDLSSISCPTFPIGILHLIHLRYLALCVYPRLEKYLGSEVEVCSSIIDIPPLISSLCYLQNFTLYFPYSFSNRKYPFTLPLEILAMPQLRLFPNLKKLQICGVREDFYSRKDLYDFRYLDQLEELQFNLIDTFPACFLENISPSGSTLQDPPRFWKKMLGSSPAISVPPLLLPPPDAFPQKH
ncbi:hypothetical protein BC332_24104 [Capsicum chinense]|nr:hypothetical protein BC332_24104 [Capsicum chinense]